MATSTGAPDDRNPVFNSPGSRPHAVNKSDLRSQSVYKHDTLQRLVNWVKKNKVGESRSSVNT